MKRLPLGAFDAIQSAIRQIIRPSPAYRLDMLIDEIGMLAFGTDDKDGSAGAFAVLGAE